MKKNRILVVVVVVVVVVIVVVVVVVVLVVLYENILMLPHLAVGVYTYILETALA